MSKYILAHDLGTSGNKASLFTVEGKLVDSQVFSYGVHYFNGSWAEQDADDWWRAVCTTSKNLIQSTGIDPGEIGAVSFSGQMMGCLCVDRQGKPLRKAIIWADLRSQKQAAQIEEKISQQDFYRIVGHRNTASYGVQKLMWVKENEPEIYEQTYKTLNAKDYIVFCLTGKFYTEYSDANSMTCFDLNNLKWSEEIIEYAGIDGDKLPEVKPSSCIYGYTQECMLGDGIPIAGAAGDQQAALFGQCCFERGSVKNTYGTGCFLLMNTGCDPVKSGNGLLTTIAASLQGEPVQYALEGSVFVAGAAIQWLRDELQIIRNAAESEAYCREVEDTNGVYVVPAFTGLGAPYWDPYARGTVVGLTRGASRAHLVRATVESLAFQVADVLEAMEEEAGTPFKSLKADGGACANDFLMQFQADILDVKVQRPSCIETTALGAAYLAGLAADYWKSREDIRRNWKLEREFTPQMDGEKRRKLKKGWKKAVHCAFDWAREE